MNAEEHLTERLRQTTAEHGWPDEVTYQMSAVVDFDGVKIAYPDEIAGQVWDLEYGTQEQYPQPAIRRFLNRIESHDGDRYMTEVMTSLGVV